MAGGGIDVVCSDHASGLRALGMALRDRWLFRRFGHCTNLVIGRVDCTADGRRGGGSGEMLKASSKMR